MKLTPIDIQQQQFRSTFRGFDPKEVDAFLDQVAHALEDAIRESNALKDEVRAKDAQLAEHKERERTLKETMITATRIADEVKQQARKEADIIISQAELQAEQLVQNAHQRLARVMDDINELKRQRAQFEASLKAAIHAHQRLLEAVSEREVVPEREPMTRRRGLNGEARSSGDDA
jgi:cell division initiation protein